MQKRIYKAVKEGRLRTAKKLAKLLNRSHSAIVLGVRKVTTDNKGRKTAGVDLKTALTKPAKVKLVKEILDKVHKGWHKYKAKPAKRVMIPKSNGKRRPLGIPTISDRAMQMVTKMALEPYYEARFESCSYGFRPAMSIHDAIDDIFKCLSLQSKWIRDADIKGCFDNLDHKFLLKQIDTHWVPIVKQWLKAGLITVLINLLLSITRRHDLIQERLSKGGCIFYCGLREYTST